MNVYVQEVLARERFMPSGVTHILFLSTARGSVVDWDSMLHAGRSRVRVLMRCFFFNLHNLSSRTIGLWSTQPQTELSTRKLPGGGKGSRRVRLTTLPPSVSRLSRETVEASMFHNLGLPRPVTGIVVLGIILILVLGFYTGLPARVRTEYLLRLFVVSLLSALIVH
jgi:hypothetical protein